MIPLVRFELRKQLPFLLLMALLAAMDVVYLLLTELPHELSYFDYLERFGYGDLWIEGLYFYFLVMAFCSGLIMREHDERTIEFLDSLPLSRTRILLAKVIAGLAILMILPVSELLFFAATGVLGRDSLNPASDLPLLLVQFSGIFALFFVLFGYALLVSHFRRFGWLLTAVIYWGILTLVQVQPGLGVLNPFLLIEIDPQGMGPDLGLLFGHLSASAVCVLVTWGIFAGGRARLQLWYERLSSVPWGRAVLTVAGAAVGLVGLVTVSLILQKSWSSTPELYQEPGLHAQDWTVMTREVPGFSASYPRSQRDRASVLLESAPEVRDQVVAFFGVPLDGTLRLDLTGSRQHTAGTTQWRHIKMGLETGSAAKLRAVLGHELAHACMNCGGAGNLKDGLFQEGMASFVEREFFDPEGRAESRKIAATIWKWHEIEFWTLSEIEALRVDYDWTVIYPLGELFFAEMVALNGREAARKLVQAFARESVASEFGGAMLWQFVFQRAGVDLVGAVDGWRTRLESLVEEGEVVAEAPPVGVCSFDQDFVYVVPSDEANSFEVPEDWRIICRMRPWNSASDIQCVYAYLESGADGDYFWVSRDQLTRQTFSYQLGFASDENWVYGRWHEVRF